MEAVSGQTCEVKWCALESTVGCVNNNVNGVSIEGIRGPLAQLRLAHTDLESPEFHRGLRFQILNDSCLIPNCHAVHHRTHAEHHHSEH